MTARQASIGWRMPHDTIPIWADVHPTTVVWPGVRFGRGVEVGAFCELGSPDGAELVIGDGARIRSHTVMYGGSEYGPGLATGHHVLLRDGITAGCNLLVGSHSSLEGGAEIGDYVRIRSRCEMTLGRLGHFTHMFTGSVITDNRRPPFGQREPVTVGDGAVLCAHALVIAGVRLGEGCFIAGGAIVDRDVGPGMVWERHYRNARHRPVSSLRVWTPEAVREFYPRAAHKRLSALLERINGTEEARIAA